MDRWPQRSAFRTRLEEYQIRTGKSREEVAAELGRSKASLDGWLTRSGTMPPEEVKRKAAQIFGCSVTEFIDDPGAAVAGQSLEGLSETRRFVARLMLEDLKAEDPSDDDVRILMEDHQRALERLRALKGRTGK